MICLNLSLAGLLLDENTCEKEKEALKKFGGILSYCIEAETERELRIKFIKEFDDLMDGMFKRK